MRAPMPVQGTDEELLVYIARLKRWDEDRLEAAKAAAPYCHGRLANVQHAEPDGKPVVVKRVFEIKVVNPVDSVMGLAGDSKYLAPEPSRLLKVLSLGSPRYSAWPPRGMKRIKTSRINRIRYLVLDIQPQAGEEIKTGCVRQRWLSYLRVGCPAQPIFEANPFP
jgi:hypothetical protein